MSEREHLTDETLNEYLDGALSARALTQAEGHLRVCDACARRLRLRGELFAALDDLPEVPLKTDLAPRIVEILQSRLPVDRPRRRAPSWSLGFALAAEAVGALALLALAAPDALSQLEASILSGITGSFLSAAEEVGVYLSALVASPDPLGIEALVSGLGAPSIPWASVSSLITLLAASTLAWLLGNGILLRRGPLSEQRRQP
jgi:anti-sigma factor RsiW